MKIFIQNGYGYSFEGKWLKVEALKRNDNIVTFSTRDVYDARKLTSWNVLKDKMDSFETYHKLCNPI